MEYVLGLAISNLKRAVIYQILGAKFNSIVESVICIRSVPCLEQFNLVCVVGNVLVKVPEADLDC